ncbi:MAG: peptidylprolyl isomerase [Rhodospirillales bacterium]|nr:peptidylprolyl isomerase [Rhodospirillales bacterium]
MVAAAPAGAQEVQRIVAVVNDDVISNYDLSARIHLIVVSSSLSNTPEIYRRLQPQVLRSLIDEKLQIQEAQRLSVAPAQAEIDQTIERIEQGNRMPPGGLEQYARQNGIERSTLIDQIRAGVAWQKVIARRVRPNIQVGEDEVDEILARFNSSQGLTEYLLGEIFLPIDNPDQEEEVRQGALNLLDQMRENVPFSAIARQFSQSASASTGGDIGWVQKGQFDPEIEEALAEMQPGQATQPLHTVAGFYIYLMRDKRTIAAPSPEDAKVTLAQFLLPIEPGAAPPDIEAQNELAQTLRETIAGCEDLNRVAGELGISTPERIENLRVGDLATAVRTTIVDLPVGRMSPTIRVNPGLLLLMVCARENPVANLPSREDIEENLMRQRIDLQARRYLRDLRRIAFVDVRA